MIACHRSVVRKRSALRLCRRARRRRRPAPPATSLAASSNSAWSGLRRPLSSTGSSGSYTVTLEDVDQGRGGVPGCHDANASPVPCRPLACSLVHSVESKTAWCPAGDAGGSVPGSNGSGDGLTVDSLHQARVSEGTEEPVGCQAPRSARPASTCSPALRPRLVGPANPLAEHLDAEPHASPGIPHTLSLRVAAQPSPLCGRTSQVDPRVVV